MIAPLIDTEVKRCPICDAPAGFHDQDPHRKANALIDPCPVPRCHRHRPGGVCPTPGHGGEEQQ